MLRHHHTLLAGGLLCFAAARPLSAQPFFTGIGTLDGGVVSTAQDISADGSVVLGEAGLFGGAVVRWTREEGLVALTPGVFSSDPGGCIGTGGVLAASFVYQDQQTTEAFRWTSTHGAVVIGDLPGGEFRSGVRGVSGRGDVLVGYGVNPQGNTEGWVAYLGPACRADFDESGTVDAEDVAAYLTAWQNQSIFADWDYDGFINSRDLLGFLNEWVAKPGCE